LPRKLTKPKQKTVTFEQVLAAFRRGTTAARRLGWHAESKLVRVDNELFIKNKPYFGPAPKKWEPYPQDFLSKDWVVLS